MWQKIKDWWHTDIETIWWARIQLFVGAVWTTLVSLDLAPLLDPKWLTIWLIASGVVTEIIRRHKATDV